MVLRKWLELAIEELKKDVNKMATLVIKNITDSLKAFEENNLEEALEIKKRDVEVDKLEDEISKKVLEIIWKEQPLASDLRLVTGIYKLITDLERIGDHATDIANITIKTAELDHQRLIPITTQMATIAKEMVLNSVDAFFTFDVSLAEKTIKKDDEVDALFDKVTNLAIAEFKEEEIDAEFGVYLLFVAKYIERIADHATNICEWLIYIVSGKHREVSLI
ncbi:MAG: phosphate signaling complex protein PhoU [Acholeplasmataceae bacterium]|nr:phosphate signaling complex protein PhoU [Acholeplasmataceae bacterium]